MNENFNLEEMRQQMTTLKNKLNQQEIVNDRLIRRSMRNEVSNINRRYNIIMAIGILMVPYGYWCFSSVQVPLSTTVAKSVIPN